MLKKLSVCGCWIKPQFCGVRGGQDEIRRQQMAASIEDYAQIYQQALTAYAQQNYEEAATLIDQVVQHLSQPNTHLLRGHVYYVLQKYEIASTEYQKVLNLTNDEEIAGFARSGLENINQYQQQFSVTGADEDEQLNFSDLVEPEEFEPQSPENSTFEGLDDNDFDLSAFNNNQQSGDDYPLTDPFEMPTDCTAVNNSSSGLDSIGHNPFVSNPQPGISESNSNNWDKVGELELPAFWQDEIPTNSFTDAASNATKVGSGNSAPENINDSPFVQLDLPANGSNYRQAFLKKSDDVNETTGDFNFNIHSTEDETLSISQSTEKTETKNDTLPFATINIFPEGNTDTQTRPTDFSTFSIDLNTEEKHSTTRIPDQNSFDADDSFDFEAFESAFGSDSLTDKEITGSYDTKSLLNGRASQGSNVEFLDDFDEFDDLGNIPGFDVTSGGSTFGDSQLRSGSLQHVSPKSGKSSDISPGKEASNRDDELFSITSSQEAVPIFTQSDVSRVDPQVNVEQGLLAPLENAPLETKQWFIAGTVGVVSALVVAVVSFAAVSLSPTQQRESVRNTGWAMALAAGITGFATTGLMGNLTFKQIRRTTRDLQSQFDAVRQGNLGVQATVYSEDEFGQLAAGFNEMTRVIFTTTSEATRKAHEQEEAKENLQRQVIRLLDDVEGAARGDLTVQAEVTADVLGAVADAFNLTIQNLRDIVQQVKVAAREVTKGATNSETFARALSTDALRQAEELAVTLNSVQVMTDSIQRVAEAAREAETVARDASEIALKGGVAVENTVAGILEIRETVAETTRKVKRLAESSQEISKIVALISQIASRTNLLALNASIEAARAGDAGRGFAIVADEVRQLADKSAKSLKEIEQIVMQIQSETSSVMTAMEEGTQQVIAGTKLAEEAKRSLDNIIQVANRIDILVCSITADTVDQTETSRAVAQVMQSVELTAQETSQEAQRVSGALQHLVGVSRDLIASVERFRVETAESR
jgi:twitching motility protein PilJ